MKRSLGAVAVVVLLGAGHACADYLEIKVDVKNANPYIDVGPASGNTGAPGQPGGFGGNRGGGFGKPNPGANFGKPTTDTVTDEHLWVTVYLEIKGKVEVAARGVAKVDHQFGKATFIPDLPRRQGEPPPFMQVTKIVKEPLAREFAKSLKKAKDAPDAKELVKLAFKAWSYGLMKEFHATIDELKKVDAKHPVVKAYRQVQKQLKAPLADDDPALKSYLDALRSEGYRPVVSEQGHYALYANLPPVAANDAQIKRRLLRLEETLESFYYWFALQDNVPMPPLPRYRLLGLLINDPNDFHQKYRSFGSVPMLGDGFTPRRDNIMILSAKRLDEAYTLLDQKTQAWLRKITATQEELLHGDISKRPDLRRSPMPVAIIQTLVVVQKALEDEAERTTLSHEAVRQLLAASGLLPRQVAAPEWIQEGLAAYFERPFGAVYGFGGLPSWSNLVAFKFNQAHGLGKGRRILVNVISDHYFQTAREASAAALDLEDGNEKSADKAQADWERARATSWGLVYYLANEQNMDRLFNYANEIAQMPRDLDLDEHVLEACFAKAFGLADAKNALQLDPSRVQAFADKWIEFMKGVDLELPEVERSSMEILNRRTGAAPKKNGPLPKSPQAAPPPPPPPN